MNRTIKEKIDKGHSFYMIVQDHPEFDITERTLYYYQGKGYLSTSNIDLPRKVRYKKEKELYQKINLKEKNKIVELVEHIRNLLTILKKTILIIM